MIRRRCPFIVVLAAVTIATSRPSLVRADESEDAPLLLDSPARKAPPELPTAPAFSLPPIRTMVLDNGVRVYLVERHELPIVSLRVIATRGVADAKPGVASLASSALQLGTTARNASNIAGAFSQIGMIVHNGYSYDAIWIEADLLSTRLADGLSLMGEVFQNANVPPDMFESERANKVARVSSRATEPNALVRSAIASSLYPASHPYHETLEGNVDTLKAATREEVVAFFETQVRPDTTAIIVAGDVDASRLESLAKRFFERWKGNAAPRRPIPELIDPSSPQRITVLDRWGSTQATISLAEVGVPRNHTDRDALAVLNAILGGRSGRLSTDIRETRGSAYSAWSFFEMGRGPRPFVLTTSVVPEKAAGVTSIMLNEVNRIVTEPVTVDELALGKAVVLSELPIQFTSLHGTVRALTDLATSNRPLDDYATLAKRLDALTPERLLAVAKRRLRPDAFRVFIVTQAAKVKDPLRVLGLGRVAVQPVGAGQVVDTALPANPSETF
jgi:predicted Zn-dependent peptidase